MNKFLKKISVFFISFLVLSNAAFAKSSPIENLYEYNLENGLTLFAFENHTVPLVYIEIAVRAGAISQTPENAGLFHLYEHMMFKGNSLYKDAASVNKALAELGVTNWNGSTSTDYVNYFFTIPSDKLTEGLEFWNAAIRSPSMKESEFESEKKVVLSEIEGNLSSPSSIYSHFINHKIFPDAPYKTDSGGALEVIKNASINQLKAIQNEYYVPSNAALFVGGDINPEQTFELVKKIYGSWSNNSLFEKKTQSQQKTNPFEKNEFNFMPYDTLPQNLALIQIFFRGPDVEFDKKDTYTADFLLMLLDQPQNYFSEYFKKDKKLSLSQENIWASYGTSRASGIFEFGATVSSPQENLVERAKKMLSDLQQKVLPKIANQKSLYSQKNKQEIIRRIFDNLLENSETAQSLLSTLRFWWCASSTEYYYDYIKNISNVSQKDVQDFIQKYFSKPAMVNILASPANQQIIFEQSENSEKLNLINSENAFWWKNEKFKPNQKIISSLPENFPESKIEIFSAKNSEVKTAEYSAPEIKTFYLKNGIPLYVQKTSSHNTEIAIAVRGGVENLTKETSGLESSLFNLMQMSSKKFSSAKLQELSYKTGMSFNKTTKMTGSAFGISVLDKYAKTALEVLTDCFLNPEFTNKNFKDIETQVQSQVASLQNNVQSMLSNAVTTELYKNHPYEVQPNITLESAQNITLKNLKEHHKTLLNPKKLFVLATGNLDFELLLSELNKSLGNLKPLLEENKKSEAQKAACKEHEELYKNPPALQIQKTDDFVLTHPSANGTAFVARVFASPSNTSEDYIPAVIASNIYADILFNVVREHYGACYSPTSYVIGSKAPYGTEYIYRLSDFENYRKYMAEARNYMAQGKLIEEIDSRGNYVFTSIEKRLEGYKNAWINSTYEGVSSSEGLALNLIYNILQFDNIYYDSIQLEQVHSVSADDIKSVFKKYWLSENTRWFIVKGEQ